MQSNFGAKSGTESGAQGMRSGGGGGRKQPSRFVEHMQQLFGDEPDPLFLEESWSVGVARATENMHRRQREQMARENELRNCALRELGRIASLRGRGEAVSEAEELGWKTADWAGSEWVQAEWIASESRRAGWTPRDWRPADQEVQRALPHGWVPQGVPSNFERETARRAVAGAITTAQAEEMLGVAAGCSREEIRSAYRRMVGMCHPDKYQHAGEAVRARATQTMTELNEAYRMLCESLMEQAA